MEDRVTEIMEFGGYWGILLLMFLENIFPPIPSEIVMPAAGFAARKGEMTLVGVVLAGTAGAMLGALPWYYVSCWLGGERLRGWVARHGRWMGLKVADVDRANAWFARHGRKAVFFGRLVPGVRTLISIPAGLAEMPLLTFLAYSAAGTALWTAFLAGLGWWLRDQYEVVERRIGWISTAVAIALVIAAVVWLIRRKARQKAGRIEAGEGAVAEGDDRAAADWSAKEGKEPI